MAKKNHANLIAIAVLAVLGAGAFGYLQWASHSKDVAADRAAAQSYVLDGAPCSPLTPAEFAARRATRKATTFEAETARFVMGGGSSTCRAFNTSVGKEIGVDFACRFNNPRWLEVKTPTTTAHFATSGAATIAVTDGAPRCTQGER